MIPETTLKIAGRDHEQVRRHLYPGDGCEAAAILVCTRVPGSPLQLLVQSILLVPHKDCARREPDRLTWPGAWLEKGIEAGENEDKTLILIHSHPGGLFTFSQADDESDAEVMPCIFSAYGTLHGTAIMTPDGAIRARVYSPKLERRTVDKIMVAGDDIRVWWGDAPWNAPRGRPLAFTMGMTTELGRLRAVVIGVSGTGSIVTEEAARLGFGSILLIDFDTIEAKNLNRILNSTLADAAAGRSKIEMMAAAIARYRGPGVADPLNASIATREAVLAASQADVIFSCTDTLESRMIAERLSAAFLIPLFDVGVVIPAGTGPNGPRIEDVMGRVDYVQPGGSNLFDRGVYTSAGLREEQLRRDDPAQYQQLQDEGYIKGLTEEAPSVITLNMAAAAACMNEFVARACPYRHDGNAGSARTIFSLAAREHDYYPDAFCKTGDDPLFAQGAAEPLLGLTMLDKPENGS
jgi:hypothetical protein